MRQSTIESRDPSEDFVTASLAVVGLVVTAAVAIALRPLPKPLPAGSSDGNPQDEVDVPASSVAPPVPGDVTSGGSDYLGDEAYGSSSIVSLTSMNFAYGFAMACQGLLIVPSEAKRLWPEHSSFALGLLAILAGVAQLVGPEAGYWSDTYRSRIGRRRPMLIISVGALFSLSFALWFFSLKNLSWAYLITFPLQQMAFNVMHAVQAGLVPDLVLAERHGIAGSMSASHILVGAFLAFLGMMNFPEWEYHWYYGFTAVVLLACAAVVTAVASEVSSAGLLLDTLSPTGCLNRYMFDVNRHWDFFLLLVTKTIYVALVVSKGFLLYFIRDAFQLSEVTQSQEIMKLLGELSLAAEGTAALGAIAVLLLANRGQQGRAVNLSEDSPLVAAASSKPWSQWALILGSIWMAFMWNGPTLVASRLMANSSQAASSTYVEMRDFMLIGMALWGIGQGVYLAGDQALLLALLPDRREASRYLAFNCLCAFIGSSIGGIIVGTLLATFGERPGTGYALPGYIAVFGYASLSSLLLAGVAYRIRVEPSSNKEQSSDNKEQ